MTQLDFIGHLETTELTPGAFVVSAHGAVDGRMAGELRNLLMPLAGTDGGVLIVDLADAHGLDDDSLEVIAEAAHVALCRGHRLGIITRSATVTSRIVDCGLDEKVTLHASLDEATDVA